MKKAILIMGGIVLSTLAITASAQTDTTVKPTPVTTEQTQPVTTEVKRWDPKNNPTVEAINEKYKDKYVGAKPATTTNDIFPVLGQYESTTNADAASVTITLDPENKGVVWIEGLPQGKVKAMLRQSPATYKIPAQKTEDGKDVAEGTAIYDKDTKTLSMVIGKEYNAANPQLVFAPEPVAVEPTEKVIVKKDNNKTKIKSKKDKEAVAKVKPWMYTGTKIEPVVATNNQ